MGTVTGVDPKTGAYKVAFDGLKFEKALTAGSDRHGHIDRAWASTSVGAQGRTVKDIYGCFDSSNRNVTDRRAFYNTMARAKEGWQIYTDDKARLVEAVRTRESVKTTALDGAKVLETSRAPESPEPKPKFEKFESRFEQQFKPQFEPKYGQEAGPVELSEIKSLSEIESLAPTAEREQAKDLDHHQAEAEARTVEEGEKYDGRGHEPGFDRAEREDATTRVASVPDVPGSVLDGNGAERGLAPGEGLLPDSQGVELEDRGRADHELRREMGGDRPEPERGRGIEAEAPAEPRPDPVTLFAEKLAEKEAIMRDVLQDVPGSTDRHEAIHIEIGEIALTISENPDLAAQAEAAGLTQKVEIHAEQARWAEQEKSAVLEQSADFGMDFH